MTLTSTAAALSGLRVLDLSGPLGNYCGKLFADMGADVILVEPPSGTPLRFEPPYIANIPGLERSLAYAYHNTSKRGISLDLNTHRGQTLLRKLAERADLLIETETPGVMQNRSIDYQTLSALRPQLVVVSITAFGQSGPYAQYDAQDLVALALGGMLYLGGYPDAAPTRAYGNQSYMCASLYGAVSAMIAVLEAKQSGRGQHVDVSMQECVVLGQENAVQFYDLEGTIRKRAGGDGRFAGYGMFECQDGHIYMLAGGLGENRFWPRTVQWLIEETVQGADQLQGDEWLKPEYLRTDNAKRIFKEIFVPWAKTRWAGLIETLGTPAWASKGRWNTTAVRHESCDELDKLISAETVNWQAEAIMRALQGKGVSAGVVQNAEDVITRDPQLAHRQHWIKLQHAEMGETVYNGPPFRFSRPAAGLRSPAPLLGEHTRVICAELGLSDAEIDELIAQKVLT